MVIECLVRRFANRCSYSETQYEEEQKSTTDLFLNCRGDSSPVADSGTGQNQRHRHPVLLQGLYRQVREDYKPLGCTKPLRSMR